MTRVAVIDCGTNSIRLLIADIAGRDGRLVDVDRRTEIVRLGQGVDRTGRLHPDALARTIAMARSYGELIRASGAERIRFVATSATRDAANRAEFADGVLAAVGVQPEVISGSEEAALSFLGASASLRAARRPVGDSGPPYLVVDIGGGSTEFVLGTEVAEAARSVDIGCVRLTERHLRTDPPTAAQIAAARADIGRALDQVAGAVPVDTARTLVGLAGSVTTVAALALGLPRYDSTRIHHARIPAAEVHAVTSRLLGMTHGERAALGPMHPGRVDVIGAGALILSETVARVGVPEVIASEHDILDGIARSLV
ncbi:MAG TPA: Ppx/GppA phosphatase family protein [Actinomycetes bacterium]|nr:Ppx/GppA phosphatase family protein [Actinomycetes bacterium]